MIYIGVGNSKLQGSEDNVFFTYSLPAKITCAYSTDICRQVCYAAAEEVRYPHLRKLRYMNYEESLQLDFPQKMIAAIDEKMSKPKFANKHIYFRIHESGDFYSMNYLWKWVEIAEHYRNNPKISFGCYTKYANLIIWWEKYKNMNIHVMFSIIPDTDIQTIRVAKSYNICCFHAVPIGKMPQNVVKCAGSCGKCTLCYENNDKIHDIYIEFHGTFAKKVSKLVEKSS